MTESVKTSRYANTAPSARHPPLLDQSSALGGGRVVLVDEYSGPVDQADYARAAVEAMGDADIALLAGHGVFVTGNRIRAVHQRAVALEQRCRNAWHAEVLGTPVELPEQVRNHFAASKGDGFRGFWEAMARKELRRDPSLTRWLPPEA